MRTAPLSRNRTAVFVNSSLTTTKERFVTIHQKAPTRTSPFDCGVNCEYS
jgi:hypothetical protein